MSEAKPGKYMPGSAEPLLGIAIGFGFTWILTALISPPSGSAMDVALQLYSLQFTLCTWAMGVASSGMSLQGGGRLEAQSSVKTRYLKYIAPLLILQVLVALAISKNHLAIACVGIVVIISMLLSEVVLGRSVFWWRHMQTVAKRLLRFF